MSAGRHSYSHAIDQLIDILDNPDANLRDMRLNKLITKFDTDRHTLHQNTYLLQALAWNRHRAARLLLDLDIDKIALNIKDGFPSCRNTPLILAAKTGAQDMVRELVWLGARLDEQDYRGFTALHYACLLRDSVMIKTLIEADADAAIKNELGHLPMDYYQLELTADDVAYRYGRSGSSPALFLQQVYDFDKNYCGTNKPCVSAWRWFVAHIIQNQKIGQDVSVAFTETSKPYSVYQWACYFVKNRDCVCNARIFAAMMQCLLQSRPALNQEMVVLFKPRIHNELN